MVGSRIQPSRGPAKKITEIEEENEIKKLSKMTKGFLFIFFLNIGWMKEKENIKKYHTYKIFQN